MLFLAIVATARAQPPRVPCGERAALLFHLLDGYSEKPVAMGLDARGRVLEVLAAPSGTWSLLVTRPGGPTCLVMSGEGWEAIAPSDPGDPA